MNDPFAVTEGDRIAQLVLERIVTPEVQEVEVSWNFFTVKRPLLMSLSELDRDSARSRRFWLDREELVS